MEDAERGLGTQDKSIVFNRGKMNVLYTFFGLFFLIQLLVWRKQMSTQADLVNVATSLASAANALASTATAVEALVTSLKTGTTQLVDQTTLDSVNTSLASSQAAIVTSQEALAKLVPTTPGV